MREAILGDLKYSDGYWERTLNYKIFGSDHPINLLVSCWDDEDILQIQEEAFECFMASVDEITSSIEQTVFEHYCSIAPDVREKLASQLSAEIVPQIDRPEQMGQLVKPIDLLIKRPLSESMRIVGLLFDCSWEPSLGLAVKLENEKIVEIGPQDIVL